MNKYVSKIPVCIKNKLRIIAITLSAIFAGVFLFLAAAIYITDTCFLLPSYHMSLILKYDIYSKVGSAVERTVDSLMDNTEVNTAKDGQELIPAGSAKAINPDLIRLNIDNIINGMLLYFKGSSDFLPDICLRSANSEASALYGEETDISDNPSVKSLASIDIDKVNLSAVIMYTNRSDIFDAFKFVRLLHKAAADLPSIFLIMALTCLLSIGFLVKNKNELTFCTALCAGSAGVLGITAGSILYYWLKVLFPPVLNALIMSLPLDSNLINGYVMDLCKPLVLFLTISGLLFPLSFFYTKFKKPSCGIFSYIKKIPSSEKIKYIFLTLVFVLLTSAVFKSSFLIRNLNSNGFSAIYKKITGNNTQVKVIPAMNENVYTLEVRLVDRNTGTPISGVLIDVEGKTPVDDKSININKASNNEGSVKFNIQPGTFMIDFLPETFPDAYKIPSPIFVNIASAGITTITVDLEENN